ncbi:MAG TPA: MFS transporter [Streptosporangiaceae bacterium]|nr:MFS transporter [Streptosporangiaceae bacterium]
MSDAAATPANTSVFQALDDSKISKFQVKTMFVAGMGFFTDAYDLFVIGIVVSLLKTQWSLSTGQVSWLNSATLLASALGAIIFGRVADMLGRKRIYGYEVLILAFGAIASAFSPNYTFLLVSRIILGVGIGGDYPVSATIMSEYSGKKSRGKMVGLVFAMQGAGLVVGPLVASILLASGVSENLTWRLLLGLGAIPGLAVYYLRRQIHETPRFAMAGGAHEEAQAAIADATGTGAGAKPTGESTAKHPQSVAEGFLTLIQNRRMLIWLIGTAFGWMLLDFCYYGNSISQPEILALANPNASELRTILTQLAIVLVFAVPGYIVAILLIDRVGRRTIQILGFAMMALMFLLIGLIPSVTTTLAPFLLLYGISYFFTEFGPNMTTFIYPAELFPTDVRTTGHGISAGAGKLGAFIGAFLFPTILASSIGLRGAMVIAGVVAAAGLLLTILTLPETRGRSLEELEDHAHEAQPGKLRAQPEPA